MGIQQLLVDLVHQVLLSWWTQKLALTAHMLDASWTNSSIWQLDIWAWAHKELMLFTVSYWQNYIYNPVDMVHQHLRFTTSGINYASPSPFYPQGIFVEDIKARIEQRYDMSVTHACCQSHKQRHQWWWFCTRPTWVPALPSWQGGRDMEALHLGRVSLHKLSCPPT